MVGIADQGPGGFFQTSGPTEGIEAESLNTGFGVRGFALGNSGQGVWGESSGTTIAANGFGPDGVDGITHSANGSGVAGVNYAAGGTAVYGGAPNGGIGFQTPNNVQQGRGAGGWVKAMVFVDPFTASGTAITRCYNSQASGATVNTPPCGFSVVHEGLGIDLIDFGFQVNDRFISATQFSANSITACVMDPNNACFLGQISPNANQVLTLTVFYTGNTTDSPFWIIVF